MWQSLRTFSHDLTILVVSEAFKFHSIDDVMVMSRDFLVVILILSNLLMP